MAIEALLVLHVPPEVGSLNIKVDPVQTTPEPVIVDAKEFTVKVDVDLQPVGNK